MNKPYIVCHMMASVDGRIDCAMTEQLPGVQEYYATLDALEAPTRVSGRVTAELEMARPGAFQSEHHTPLGRTAFSKAAEAEGYEVVVDTHGTLLWDSVPEGERPLLILTSEQVSGSIWRIWTAAASRGSPAALSASICPVPATFWRRTSA